EPNRASMPTRRPPMTGTTITQGPSVFSAGERLAIDSVWKKKRLVKSRIRSSSSTADSVASRPITTASAAIHVRRALSAKSPRDADEVIARSRAGGGEDRMVDV